MLYERKVEIYYSCRWITSLFLIENIKRSKKYETVTHTHTPDLDYYCSSFFVLLLMSAIEIGQTQTDESFRKSCSFYINSKQTTFTSGALIRYVLTSN